MKCLEPGVMEYWSMAYRNKAFSNQTLLQRSSIPIYRN